MQKLRGTIIEGVFGRAKVYHGMARSRFRGLLKVEIQFLLTATALNLKKMVKILDIDKLKSELSREISGIIQTGKNIFRNFIKELAVQLSEATAPILCKPLNRYKIKRFKGGHKNANNTKGSAT